jgi:ABC-type bacteriocin/lantibiotic exporter with double-glycine peptidase domain
VKVKTALKQSVVSVRFLAFVVIVMCVLAFKYPSKFTIIPLAIFAAYLVMDAYNIHRIRRKAARDPNYLDKRIN